MTYSYSLRSVRGFEMPPSEPCETLREALEALLEVHESALEGDAYVFGSVTNDATESDEFTIDDGRAITPHTEAATLVLLAMREAKKLGGASCAVGVSAGSVKRGTPNPQKTPKPEAKRAGRTSTTTTAESKAGRTTPKTAKSKRQGQKRRPS